MGRALGIHFDGNDLEVIEVLELDFQLCKKLRMECSSVMINGP